MSLLDKEPVQRVEKILKDFDESQNIIVLETSARTALEAASFAVLAEVSRTIMLRDLSNSLSIFSTRFTGSLFNKVIIQLLIVS